MMCSFYVALATRELELVNEEWQRKSPHVTLQIVVAGGQESMSNAPHCMNLRNPLKMGDGKMVDTMMNDGLVDAFHSIPMGMSSNVFTRSPLKVYKG
jgi:hypothetical protein